MAEVRPGVAVLAVVLANRAPLALAEVRTPAAPRHSLASLIQTLRFARHGLSLPCARGAAATRTARSDDRSLGTLLSSAGSAKTAREEGEGSAIPGPWPPSHHRRRPRSHAAGRSAAQAARCTRPRARVGGERRPARGAALARPL